MSLRISSALAALALASCGGPPDAVAPGNDEAIVGGTPAEAPAEHIACATSDAEMTDACTIERTPVEGGTLVTIRHPDGAFRRLRVSTDGGVVTAADGAQPLAVLGRGEAGIDVAIGDARYRLPPGR